MERNSLTTFSRLYVSRPLESRPQMHRRHDSLRHICPRSHAEHHACSDGRRMGCVVVLPSSFVLRLHHLRCPLFLSFRSQQNDLPISLCKPALCVESCCCLLSRTRDVDCLCS